MLSTSSTAHPIIRSHCIYQCDRCIGDLNMTRHSIKLSSLALVQYTCQHSGPCSTSITYQQDKGYAKCSLGFGKGLLNICMCVFFSNLQKACLLSLASVCFSQLLFGLLRAFIASHRPFSQKRYATCRRTGRSHRRCA